MAADLQELERLIAAALPGADVEVVDEGGGDHLRAIVTAPQFEGLTRIDQHRLVRGGGQGADGRRHDPCAFDHHGRSRSGLRKNASSVDSGDGCPAGCPSRPWSSPGWRLRSNEQEGSARVSCASPTTVGERPRRRPPPSELGATAEALLEGSPEGVAVVDASGAVVFWNAAAEQLFGLERSRAIGQELASLIFPDHLQAAVRAVLLREVDEPGEGLAQRQIELGARRADGREIPVDIATTLDRGRLRRGSSHVYLRDASERSERERELHSDARRRSAVLDLGQVALEGMALDELLQRAVALSIDELGVDRCEVWKRDEGGDSADPARERRLARGRGGDPGAARDSHPARLHVAAGPGSDRRRGLPPRGSLQLDRADRLPAPAQSSISIRIPGTIGGFGIARSPPPRTCAASSSATSASSSRSRRRSARRSSAPGRSTRSPRRAARSAS